MYSSAYPSEIIDNPKSVRLSTQTNRNQRPYRSRVSWDGSTSSHTSLPESKAEARLLASLPKHWTGRLGSTDSGVSIPITRTFVVAGPTLTVNVSPSITRATRYGPSLFGAGDVAAEPDGLCEIVLPGFERPELAHPARTTQRPALVEAKISHDGALDFFKIPPPSPTTSGVQSACDGRQSANHVAPAIRVAHLLVNAYPMASYETRFATVADIVAIQNVEVDAGKRFIEVGMPEIAADPPLSTAVLRELIAAQSVWITQEQLGQVAGYVIAIRVDDGIHIDQISVRRDHARRGIGSALLDHVSLWGQEVGARRATLFTFEEVPWNAPYYRRLGFSDIPDTHLGPELREVLDAERQTDLHLWNRVALARRLRP